MTTLFKWHSADGKVRRCDARCHTAARPRCACICGGKYHGCIYTQGGVQAAANDVLANVAAWRTQEERAAAEQQRDQVQPESLQLTLFDGR